MLKREKVCSLALSVSSVSGENCAFGSLPGFLLGYWVKLGHGTVGLAQICQEAVEIKQQGHLPGIAVIPFQWDRVTGFPQTMHQSSCQRKDS